MVCSRYCHKDHLQVAVAYFDDKLERDVIEQFILMSLKAMNVDPWCGICYSRKFHFVHEKADASTPQRAAVTITTEQVQIALEHKKAQRQN